MHSADVECSIVVVTGSGHFSEETSVTQLVCGVSLGSSVLQIMRPV